MNKKPSYQVVQVCSHVYVSVHVCSHVCVSVHVCFVCVLRLVFVLICILNASTIALNYYVSSLQDVIFNSLAFTTRKEQ